MRYLLYTLEYPPQIGGVGEYYYNLALHWPTNSQLIVYDVSEKGIKFNFRFIYWPKLIIKLINNLKKEKVDYVLIGHILPLGAITYFASFFYNFSYSVCFHGLDYSSATKKKYKKFFSYLILKKSKKIICANSFVANSISTDFPKLKNRIIISHPGAQVCPANEEIVAQIKKKYSLGDKKLIFSIGRLIERKGFDNMIKALATLKKEKFALFDQCIYLLAGTGPDLERLRKISREHKVADKVFFLGKVSQKEKFALYSLCHFFAMPARQIAHDYEGFGIVYLEANLFKKAVLAGKSGGVSDAVVHNVNGLLIDPDNLEQIKTAIADLLNNDNLTKKLGDEAYARAKSRFNWHSLANNLKENL